MGRLCACARSYIPPLIMCLDSLARAFLAQASMQTASFHCVNGVCDGKVRKPSNLAPVALRS
jgi:hypothetical protein